MRLGRRSILAIALVLSACDETRVVDGGTDADLPDPSLVDIPWLAAGNPPVAPSPDHACPTGFRSETTDTGIISCRPWPASGPATCTGVQAHFVGEPSCARIGTACPSGDFPEGLPTGRTIVYVRAGATGGNGSMAMPYDSVGYAVSQAPPGAIVAVAKGTYDGRVDLFSNVTVWGACPEETILTQSVPSETDTVVGAFVGDGELRNVTVRAPGTMGVYVDMGVSVRILDVLVDGAAGYGMYLSAVGTNVDLENVIVRNTVLFPSGNGGVGVQAIDGATVSARRTSIETSAQTNLVVAYDAVGTFERIVLRDATGVSSLPRPGAAMAVQQNGRATLTASAAWGNAVGGLLSGVGGQLTVSDIAIEETGGESSTGTAAALEVRVSATLDASFVYVERARGAAIVGSEDGVMTASDIVVRNTQPATADFDSAGTAMSLEGTSSCTLTRALMEGNLRGTIVTRPGTRLTATDLVIRDTGASGPRELGIAMSLFGSENVFDRVIVERSTLEGVAVSGAGATATLRDVVIRDTRGTPSTGVYGRGLEVNLGAQLDGERIVLERNREVSLFAVDADSVARLSNLLIRDSLGSECGDACPDGQQFGYGATAINGGRIELSGFVVTRGRLLGLQVAAGSSITGTRGEVSRNVIGINVQEPTYDFTTALTDVLFVDNERNLDALFLPLPDPAL